MQNSIDEFYDNIISPFVREFEDDRSNLKRAYGAAWALDGFASHIFYFYQPTRKMDQNGDIDFKKKISAQSP